MAHSLDELPISLVELVLEHHAFTSQTLAARQLPSTSSTRRSERLLPSAADLFVSNLPGLPQDSRVKLYAGHLPAFDPQRASSNNHADPHLFFLLAKAKHISDRPRTIFWFNGGPGCSSFDGALMEMGPLRVVKGKNGGRPTVVEAPHSWSEYADVVFVDQPAGTGLSFINEGAGVTELGPAAEQVAVFINNFYKVFPELASSDTYFAGESYAGMYIPYIAEAFLSMKAITAPLKGLLMGNAWVDPQWQYPAYLEYAYQKKLLKKGSKEAKKAVDVDARCKELLQGERKGRVLVEACEALLQVVIPPIKTKSGFVCRNSYNINLKSAEQCQGAEFPANSRSVASYLHETDVVSALHATQKHSDWVQCNNTISNQMWSPKSRPSIELLPDLLKQMPIILYAGELDLMCNYVGLEASIDHLSWNGSSGMKDVPSMDWWVGGHQIGTWSARDNLHWVRYTNASHMVMLEEPAAAHDMVLRFLGIDVLQAAGPSAVIPSRLGSNASELVLNKVQIEGTASAGAGGAAAAAVSNLSTPSTTRSVQEQHQDHEAKYGPRRFGVLVVVLLAVLGVGLLVLRFLSRRHSSRRGFSRRSTRHRAQSEAAKRKGKGKTGRSSFDGQKGRRAERDSVELEALMQDSR